MKNVTQYWEHYSHEADIGIRGIGATVSQAFEQAALSLTAVIVKPEKVLVKESINIECLNSDIELLFYDWINSIIYEMAYKKMLFSSFKVDIRDGKLKAEVSGERVDRKRHQPVVEIKGATLTTLKVMKINDGHWLAQTVVDV